MSKEKIELTDEQKKILEVKNKIDALLQEAGLIMVVDHLVRIMEKPKQL